jgi:hypothetical protein
MGAIVPITNGVPGPAQTVSGVSFLIGVACTGTSGCVAVGSHYSESGSSSTGVIVPINNGAPSAVVPVAVNELDGVTCLPAKVGQSTTSCLTVGSTDSATGAVGVIVPTTIPNGVAGKVETVQGSGALGGVGCQSTARCVAVGRTAPAGPGAGTTGGVVVSVPLTGGPFKDADQGEVRADLPAAFENAKVTCTPVALGARGFDTGTLINGTRRSSRRILAVARVLTRSAATRVCRESVERLHFDDERYNDPPGFDFNQVVNPTPIAAVSMPRCKRWRGGARSVCLRLSRSERKWAQTAERVTSIDQALATTLARESSAVAANDLVAASFQDAHIPALEQQEKTALTALAAEGKAVARVLKSHHVAYRMNKTQSGNTIRAIERNLARKGITAAQLTELVGPGILAPRAVNVLTALT